MREHRKTHPLSADERKKMNARAYAHVYLNRGRIERKPCVVCGNGASQMHHADYDKPLEVTWLCRWHHLDLHWPATEHSPDVIHKLPLQNK
jgi:hypothetical protein